MLSAYRPFACRGFAWLLAVAACSSSGNANKPLSSDGGPKDAASGDVTPDGASGDGQAMVPEGGMADVPASADAGAGLTVLGQPDEFSNVDLELGITTALGVAVVG